MSQAQRRADDRIIRARAACACEPAWGIAFACPATCLPRIGHKLIVRGETCPIPYPLPVSFECPRHEIMGW
jgi:hypothetical protein